MTNNIIILFIIEFFALGVFAVVEKNWGMALYGFGGGILNVGILIINKG